MDSLADIGVKSQHLHGVLARGLIHSVFGVMVFDMWMGHVIVVFLAFSSCCLIKYAKMQHLSGGGKFGSGGGDGTGIPSLCQSGI